MTGTLRDAMNARLQAIADVAYTAGCGLNTSNPWGAVTTYPPAWLQQYVQKGYQGKDPVLAFMCSGRGAVKWSDLEMNDEQKGIMEEARGFGLEYGTVFANVVEGRKCSVSVCHSKPELDPTEIAVLEKFTLVYGLTTPRKNEPPEDETNLRYLDLVSNGATQQELQAALGLSSRAIATVKKRAIEALNCRTLPHAVATAITANLI